MLYYTCSLILYVRCTAYSISSQYYYKTSVKARKVTGSNIVVFCILMTILNTLSITMQNDLHISF